MHDEREWRDGQEGYEPTCDIGVRRSENFELRTSYPRISLVSPFPPVSLQNSFSAACYTERHGPTQGKDRQFAVLPTRICYTFASDVSANDTVCGLSGSSGLSG